MKKENKKNRGNLVDVITNTNIRMVKKLARLTLQLTIGAGYGLYTVLERVYDLISKLFNKLPKVAKMVVIYLIIGIMLFLSLNVRTIYQAVEVEKEKEVVSYVTIEDNTCKMEKLSCEVFIVGKAYGLTEEQSMLAVAISRWETGNYTSSAFKNKHNFGGNMSKDGLKTFDNDEQGLNYFINNLKTYYFDKGLNTVAQIQMKYAPIGTANDPKNLNSNWLTGVTKLYEGLRGAY